jgi:DNA primase small subunit
MSEQKRRKVEDEKEDKENENADKSSDKTGANNNVPHDVHEFMKSYYANIFPTKTLFQWLNYGNDGKHARCDRAYAQNREFCFTLQGDIFVRYNSYADFDSLRKDLRTKVPGKIDIGPVFNYNPKNRLMYSANFKPVERELVMDIDMTDYDDVRTCCDAANICPKCWPLMNCAMKVLDEGMRDDFGFEHILWVYSGRRGIHAWVCDERARKLSDEERSAVAEYFSVFKGVEGGSGVKKTNLGTSLHPRMQKAYDKVLLKFWKEEYLPAQNLMTSEKHFRIIMDMIPDPKTREEAEFDFKENKKPKDGQDVNTWRWERIEKNVEKALKNNKTADWKLKKCLHEVVFGHVYPRLDVEVSKHMNHLLKAPFCVHPKTGRVCVPIDPKKCDAFDPFAAPQVHTLLEEFKALGNKEENVEKTAMGEALRTFERCFWKDLKIANEEALAQKARDVVEAKQQDMEF